MKNMKSFTDIEQSKKLAEILPLESADMAWTPRANAYKEWYEAENTRIVTNYEKKNYIPCWSLAALLGVYPMVVGQDMDMYCSWSNNLHSKHYNNPIDACYEMILKLHELNLL